jgi:acetyl-CoA synthetase (ADP-forming)
MRAIENAFPRKPILMLKGGKSEAGKKAVLAHTGSLAGSREVFKAAIEQSGGLYMRDLEELCDAAKAFSTLSVPDGGRLLIITSSGGSGILASDTCDEVGLKLSELSGATLEKFRHGLPDWCVLGNPLDIARAHIYLYRDALKIALNDDSVDMCLLIFGDPIPDAYESLTEVLQKATKKKIPVAVSYLGGGAEVQIVETEKFQENGVPVYPTPGRAVRALSYLNKYREKVMRC